MRPLFYKFYNLYKIYLLLFCFLYIAASIRIIKFRIRVKLKLLLFCFFHITVSIRIIKFRIRIKFKLLLFCFFYIAASIRIIKFRIRIKFYLLLFAVTIWVPDFLFSNRFCVVEPSFIFEFELGNSWYLHYKSNFVNRCNFDTTYIYIYIYIHSTNDNVHHLTSNKIRMSLLTKKQT